MPVSELHEPVLTWYDVHARDLPWRRPDTSPWAVLVSEVMLQQTPVQRVLAAYEEWLTRWPQPGDLAAATPADAIRAWGRLGYPRRAVRLHAAAATIARRHGGEVPSSYDELLALPGVGAYTAAAVASFGLGQRHAVLDTNVRRVLARAVGGVAQPHPTLSAAAKAEAAALVPDDPPVAARWAVAVMELGAIVCTARSPRCDVCPIAGACNWRAAGCPPAATTRRPSPGYLGTDRHVRGLVLALLRDATDAADAAEVAAVWPDDEQLVRALSSLLADGLVERASDGYVLPSQQRP